MKDSIRLYILSWIENNNFSILHIDDLVNEVGYSRRTIETWFREKYKIPLGEYILRRRLSLAAIMLKMTSIPITDVAYLLHYHSSQGFSRAFKKLLGLTPTEYRSAKEWNFDILQPSFLLEDFKIPDITICELNESFTYDNEIVEHDHLFDTSVYDITKKIKQLLIENHPNIHQLALLPRRPELLGKSRSYLVEVQISYSGNSNKAGNLQRLSITGKYAKMRSEGSWVSYSAYNKIAFVRTMVKHRLTLRDGIHVMKFNSYSPSHVSFDIFIPVL